MGLPHRPGEDLARAKYRPSITWWWPKEPKLLHLHELHSYSRVKVSQELKDVRYSHYHWALGTFRHWRYTSLKTSVLLLFMTEMPRMAQNGSFSMQVYQRKRKNASQLSRGKERGILFCVLILGSLPYLLSPGLSKEITPKSAGLYRVCSMQKVKLCNFFF